MIQQRIMKGMNNMEIHLDRIKDMFLQTPDDELMQKTNLTTQEVKALKAGTLAFEDLTYNQIVALELLSEQNRWLTIRKLFGDRCFKTFSDRGGVLVGNESFQTLIRNGYGDGITRNAILPLKNISDFDKWDKLMNNTNITLEGKFNIYTDDCQTEDVEKELNGKYAVYYYNGLVLFLEY